MISVVYSGPLNIAIRSATRQFQKHYPGKIYHLKDANQTCLLPSELEGMLSLHIESHWGEPLLTNVHIFVSCTPLLQLSYQHHFYRGYKGNLASWSKLMC